MRVIVTTIVKFEREENKLYMNFCTFINVIASKDHLSLRFLRIPAFEVSFLSSVLRAVSNNPHIVDSQFCDTAASRSKSRSRVNHISCFFVSHFHEAYNFEVQFLEYSQCFLASIYNLEAHNKNDPRQVSRGTQLYDLIGYSSPEILLQITPSPISPNTINI